MAEAEDSDEEAPLSLRCAVAVIGERTREERDAELLSQAIDLTDDAEPVLPVPLVAAPTAEPAVLLSSDSEEESVPLAKRHRKTTSSSAPSVQKSPPDDSDDEDAPLASRTKKQRKPSHSDDEDAPLTRRKQQREAVPCAHAGAQDSSGDEAENRPLSARTAKRAGPSMSAAGSKQGDRSDEGATDADDGSDEEDDGLTVTTAKAVLALGEAGDHEGVLSSLGVPLTRASPCEARARTTHAPAGTASPAWLQCLCRPEPGVVPSRRVAVEQLRKAYRGLARLIHPDKLHGRFSGATKAFQCLARAFELLTAPEHAAAAGGGNANAAATVARSNDGCYRTPVRCPRCKAAWGQPESGLQPYECEGCAAIRTERPPTPALAHREGFTIPPSRPSRADTFLMQALKTYHCCGCLFAFGCMTAEQ